MNWWVRREGERLPRQVTRAQALAYYEQCERLWIAQGDTEHAAWVRTRFIEPIENTKRIT